MTLSFLTNKHFVIALLVAPILAILAWFAVDKLVRPEPLAAQSGHAYPLVAKPTCRYASGKCVLSNGDIEIVLQKSVPSTAASQLEMRCSLGCEFGRVELLDNTGQSLQTLRLLSRRPATLSADLSQVATIRFAAGIGGSFYYAETAASFLN